MEKHIAFIHHPLPWRIAVQAGAPDGYVIFDALERDIPLYAIDVMDAFVQLANHTQEENE